MRRLFHVHRLVGRRPAIALLLLVVGAPLVARGQLRDSNPLTLSLPGLRWALEMATPGFTTTRDERRPDGGLRYIYAVNHQTDLVLSARIEKREPGQTSHACRASHWTALKAHSLYRMDNTRMYEAGQLAIIEYVVKEIRGLPIAQKHVHGYFGRDNACLEIHLSKVEYTSRDESFFQAVLQTVRVRERSVL